MKKLLLPSMFLYLISCTHTTMHYKAQINTLDNKKANFEFRKSYKTSGLAWACGLTVFIYGGACWAYLGVPFNSQKNKLRNDARQEITSILGANGYNIEFENIEFINWDNDFPQKNLTFIDNNQSREIASIKNINVEAFENSIPDKPDINEIKYSEESDFPTDWPRKWFYETDNYKYWTIVGNFKNNQSDAIISSKEKAEDIIKKEFSLQNYKESIPYETTHNEVKKVNGKYQSWRIIRAKQVDVIKFKK